MCDEIPDEKMSSKSSDIQLKLDLDDYIYSEVIDNPPLNEEFVINEKGIIVRLVPNWEKSMSRLYIVTLFI